MKRRRFTYPTSAVLMAMLGTITGFGSLSGIYGKPSFLMFEESLIFSILVGIILLSFREYLSSKN